MKKMISISTSLLIFLTLSCKDGAKEIQKKSLEQSNKESFDLVISNANVIDVQSGVVTKQTLYINKGMLVETTPEMKTGFHTFQHINVQ